MGIVDPRTVVNNREITNFSEDCVGANSIDLRVKSVYIIDGGIRIYKDGERVLPPYRILTPTRSYDEELKKEAWVFEFSPEHLYQVEFHEKVMFGREICAISVLRSSLFKSGASGEAGLYDSGYVGGTGMTIGTKHLSLVEVDAPIAQMIFFKTSTSSLYTGYYQSEDWRKISE